MSNYPMPLPGVTSSVMTSDGNKWTSAASSSSQATSPTDLWNLGLSASVAANALTIALKQSDGSTDPGAGGSAVKIGLRSSTITSGAYNQRSATAATSVVVSSGSTLGHTSAVATYFYVYAIDNAGTVELAVSTKLFDEGSRVTTTAEGGAGAADSATAIYSTTARTDVPCRLIGRILSTQATAGTWASAMTEVSVVPFETKKVYLSYTGNAGTALTGGTTNIDFATKVVDSHNAWDGTTFTAPRPGFYVFAGVWSSSAAVAAGTQLYIGGTGKQYLGSDISASRHTMSGGYYMNAGDTATIRSDSNATLANSATLHNLQIWSQG